MNSACSGFLAICLPNVVLPNTIDFHHCLSPVDVGRVPSLQKLALSELIDAVRYTTLDDPVTERKLRDLMLEKGSEAFSPLVFGPSYEITDFLTETYRHFARERKIWITPTEASFDISATGSFTCTYPEGKVPWNKLYYVMECVFKESADSAEIFVDGPVGDLEAIKEKIVSVGDHIMASRVDVDMDEDGMCIAIW